MAGGLSVNPENFQKNKFYAVMFLGKSLLGTYMKHTKSEQTGFSAENSHEYMYNCVKWMEKPKP